MVPAPAPAPATTGVLLDAIRAVRINFDDTALTVVLLALWVSSSACCVVSTRNLFAVQFSPAASIITSMALLIVFWVATWIRYAQRGRLKTPAGWATTAVAGLWVLLGISGTKAPFTVLISVSIVGCVFLTSLVLATALEARRTGSATGHALYIFRAASERCLYVGRTNNPRRRWTEHRGDKDWYGQIATREVFHYPSLAVLIEAERKAIIRERPLHNVQHNSRGRRR